MGYIFRLSFTHFFMTISTNPTENVSKVIYIYMRLCTIYVHCTVINIMRISLVWLDSCLKYLIWSEYVSMCLWVWNWIWIYSMSECMCVCFFPLHIRNLINAGSTMVYLNSVKGTQFQRDLRRPNSWSSCTKTMKRKNSGHYMNFALSKDLN